MHNIMHAHGLGSRKGYTWPCLEVPAFEDKNNSKLTSRPKIPRPSCTEKSPNGVAPPGGHCRCAGNRRFATASVRNPVRQQHVRQGPAGGRHLRDCRILWL